MYVIFGIWWIDRKNPTDFFLAMTLIFYNVCRLRNFKLTSSKDIFSHFVDRTINHYDIII